MNILYKKYALVLVVFAFFSVVFGQNQPQITTEISPKNIKIGEQIKYEIRIETNEQVTFPQGQTFSPLEMITSESVDTFRMQEKLRLVKSYYLTQFDSGTYTIPKQRIDIGGIAFETDSVTIQVQGVAVDTLKQPLFDIKPIIPVEKTSSSLFSKWIILLIIITLCIIVFFIFKNRKKRTPQEKIALLPAFDRAILGLENLKKSRFLLESKHKEYYSELTDIIRRYLEEEIHISATESTTDELMTKIELLLDSKKLNLSTETINNLKKVLKKADLVKFAKSHPHDTEATSDLQTIENVIIKTKQSLSDPTLEQPTHLAPHQENLPAQKQKKNLTKIILTGTALILCGLLIWGGTIVYKNYFSVSVAEQHLKNKHWITSTYTFPPVQITTPVVLQRRPTQPNFKASFGFGNPLDNSDFSMSLLTFDYPVSSEFGQEDILKILEIIEHENDKQYKGKNILTKHEPYKSVQNLDGLKIFGSFDRDIDGKKGKMEYQNYLIANGKTIFIIGFVYPKSEQNQSEALIEKIMYSVQFVQE